MKGKWQNWRCKKDGDSHQECISVSSEMPGEHKVPMDNLNLAVEEQKFEKIRKFL
jgi:hypothetical protein